VFDFGSGTTSYMFLTPDAGGTNAIRFAITNGGNGSEQRLDGPAMTAGTWTHIAVTLAGNTGTLYVNGTAVATNTGMTIHPASFGGTISHDYLADSQFANDPSLLGSIDDFRLYNRALPAAQVAELADPTVINDATAAASPVTGTSTTLSALGFDVTSGESALTYTWATTGTPPAQVTFSANGTNAAKNTTATFAAAGTYNFTVTITNPGGGTTSSSVSVVVNQTLSNVTVTPGSPTISNNATQSFNATGRDQFGALMAAAPTFAWTIDSGGVGSVDPSTGLYTAPASGPGSATVRATSGGKSGTASIIVILSNIAGTAGDDAIRLVRSGSSLAVYVNNANAPAYTVPFSSLGALTISAGTGNDSITLDFSGGASPVPSAGLSVDGAGGAGDSLIITGTSADDSASVSASAVVFNNSTITYSNIEAIVINGGGGADVLTQSAAPSAVLAFNGGGGGDVLNINAGAFSFAGDAAVNSPALAVNVANAGSSASFSGTQHLSALNISAGATGTMAAVAAWSSPSVMNVTALTISGVGSAFDLHNNELLSSVTLASIRG
ncbi:MAG TPA: LamG domain-containing protein, partial [Tepidisphaeraceae bacterium]|nr:LamG domain-containing protein [Tepidisphaeraceae bacterium]